MGHSCVENYIHIIFATKNRENLIPNEIESRLHSYMGGVAKKGKSPLLILNGTENHVHLLMRLHPTVSLSTIVKEIKSYSSGWMKKQGFDDFGWQEGYGAFAVSSSMLPRVFRYIQKQKEHHKNQTFDQEVNKMIECMNLEWSILETKNKKEKGEALQSP